MGDLKPCPFCGGGDLPADHTKARQMGSPRMRSWPVLEELSEEVGGGWRVCCYGCGVQTWNALHPTAEAAVAAWNLRREPQHDKPPPRRLEHPPWAPGEG